MTELPDQLDLRVTLDGQPLAGGWVELRLLMDRKNDYVLMVGPTDAAGGLTVTRTELENQISAIQLSAFMSYASLGIWRGELVLSPFDAQAFARAAERREAWAQELLVTYPPDFAGQLATLRERLAAQPGREVNVSAQALGGAVRLTCLPVVTPGAQ